MTRLKIVCISDTHEYHGRLTIPECDLLLHAGDFTNVGTLSSIKHFNEWLGKQPSKHKVIIAGNHDLDFMYAPEVKSLITNAKYLQDEECIINDNKGNPVKIYGSPWSTAYFPQHWVFNETRGKRMQDLWNKIPTDTNILITHGPPFGFGDLLLNPLSHKDSQAGTFAIDHGGRSGCEDLLIRVKEIKPQLHLFGHIHEDRGLWTSGDTTFINASIWDHRKRTLHDPIIFYLE